MQMLRGCGVKYFGTTYELLLFSDMVRLNIMLYNSLDSEECYKAWSAFWQQIIINT